MVGQHLEQRLECLARKPPPLAAGVEHAAQNGQPRIIIIDEPTRGIDIGTKQQIYRFVRRLADEGTGVIVISSELPELIGLADRVLVMRQGRIAGEVAGDRLTEEIIVRLAMGLPAGLDAEREPA